MNKKFVDFALIITEYPKSGGTWLTSLIGDCLHIPKRDLYLTDVVINDSNNKFYKKMLSHPWYKGTTSVNPTPPCVVKSHELPNSPLITFNSKFIHLIRDGRDVAVSKYFFEKDFCLKNGLTEKFDVTFDQFVANIAYEWKNYVNAWLAYDYPTVTYEKLLIDPENTLCGLFKQMNITSPLEKIRAAITDNEQSRFRSSIAHMYSHNTFVRKCIIGDWKNHFTKKHEDMFYDIAGDLLIKLGYMRKPRLRIAIKKCRSVLRPAKKLILNVVKQNKQF